MSVAYSGPTMTHRVKDKAFSYGTAWSHGRILVEVFPQRCSISASNGERALHKFSAVRFREKRRAFLFSAKTTSKYRFHMA